MPPPIERPFAAALAKLESDWSHRQINAARAGSDDQQRLYNAALHTIDAAHKAVKQAGIMNPERAARCVMAHALAGLEIEREVVRARATFTDSATVVADLESAIGIYTACMHDLAYARLKPEAAALGSAVTLGEGDLAAITAIRVVE